MKDPTQANEGLDTHLQAEAAAIKFGVRAMPDATWDRYFADRECEPTERGDLFDTLEVTEPPKVRSAKTESSGKPNKWAGRLT